MTPERIAELRALADAATRGPWTVADLRHQRGGQIRIFPHGDIHIANVLARHEDAVANAEFIAAARSALPALLDEVERLREIRDTARVWRRMRQDSPVQPKPESAALIAAVDADLRESAGERP